MASRWRRIAFLCRYAHQDVYRLIGRDPERSPLTPIERELFYAATFECVEAEVTPRADIAAVTGAPIRIED